MTGMPAVPLLPSPPPKTRRLVLRPFTLADAPFIVVLLNSEGWLRFIGDRGVRTLDDARTYLQDGPMKMQALHGFALWAVQRRKDSATIGMCGLVRREGLDDVDVGYALLPSHTGRGYAREAAAATLRHGFEALGLKRIVAITHPDNAGSVRVLQTIGMQFERRLRLPNHHEDSLLFGVHTSGGAAAP
jgi:ribosomal-protein-alanine N-acetyltransferase